MYGFTRNVSICLAQGMTKEKKVYLHFSAVGLCVLGCVLLNLTQMNPILIMQASATVFGDFRFSVQTLASSDWF